MILSLAVIYQMNLSVKNMNFTLIVDYEIHLSTDTIWQKAYQTQKILLTFYSNCHML